jgi:hypothetical protein
MSEMLRDRGAAGGRFVVVIGVKAFEKRLIAAGTDVVPANKASNSDLIGLSGIFAPAPESGAFDGLLTAGSGLALSSNDMTPAADGEVLLPMKRFTNSAKESGAFRLGSECDRNDCFLLRGCPGEEVLLAPDFSSILSQSSLPNGSANFE